MKTNAQTRRKPMVMDPKEMVKTLVTTMQQLQENTRTKFLLEIIAQSTQRNKQNFYANTPFNKPRLQD